MFSKPLSQLTCGLNHTGSAAALQSLQIMREPGTQPQLLCTLSLTKKQRADQVGIRSRVRRNHCIGQSSLRRNIKRSRCADGASHLHLDGCLCRLSGGEDGCRAKKAAHQRNDT